MADTVRTLRVELTAGTTDFLRGLQRADSGLRGLEKSLNKISGTQALLGIGAGIASAFAGIGAALAVATRETLAYSGAIGDLADKSGHTVEWLQATKFAAEQSGTTLEAVAVSSRKLMNELADGSSETVDAVNTLGLSFSELRRQSPDEAMNAVLGALGRIEDPIRRTALATQLLGKSGQDLIPLAGNFDELRARAEQLGLVLSERDVRAAQALGDSFDALESAFGGLIRNVGAAITSNESLHVLINGLVEVFGSLSTAVAGNRDGLASFVSGGVVLVANGLVTMADAVLFAIDVWDSLRVLWLSLYNVVLQLSRSMYELELATARAFGRKQLADNIRQNIALIDAEIAANARNLNTVEQDNQKKINAVSAFRQQLAQLAVDVERAAGKEVQAAGAHRETASQLDNEGKAAEKAREALQKLNDELDDQIAKASAGQLNGLAQAYANINAEAQKRIRDIEQEAAKQGFSAAAVDNLKQKVVQLTEAQRRNAVEGERQKVIGRTFADITDEIENFKEVLDESGVALEQLTPESLRELDARFSALLQSGALTEEQFNDVAEALNTVRQRLAELDQTGPDVFEQMAREAIRLRDEEKRAAELRAQHMPEMVEALGSISSLIGTIIGETNEWGRALIGVAAGLQEGVRFGQQFAEAQRAGNRAGQAAATAGAAQSAFQSGGPLRGAATGASAGATAGGPIGAAVGAVVGSLLGAFGQQATLNRMLDEAQQRFGVEGNDALVNLAQQWGVDLEAAAREGAEGLQEALDMLEASIQKAARAQANIAEGIGQTARAGAEGLRGLLAAGLTDATGSIANLIARVSEELLRHGLGVIDQRLVGNEQFGQAGEAARFLQQIVAGFQQAGLVDQSLLSDATTATADLIAQSTQAARESGLSQEEATRAGFVNNAQLLQAQLNASLASGEGISSELQALLDEAERNGVEIVADPLLQSLDVQRQQLDVQNKTLAAISGISTGAEAKSEAPASAPEIPQFADGSGGYRWFGEGTLAMLHGWEAVVPQGDGMGLGAQVAVQASLTYVENPLQTAEKAAATRAWLEDVIANESARDLADAIANGLA